MDKYMCWDCGNDIQLSDPKIIKHVKNTNLKTVDGTYLLVCTECGKDE